ncbi:pyridoxamine 5'-phosphate oxidase family protein [Leptobacterium flavescens]|uniref:Pyridoxamine 5'-phosphate oxidase family protein n=1 Tax=Leptobacterium flavescens TaxID=472055 RepID=A0A6P0UPE5_9FLAO|nr:pyridoxamine 5'-phosphate oxidase family protein [Leptobacterium flavescens]NER14867.1 pyridoxamine 5'-phosphate oxidase family protein [Leptobacterium flavescens]
MIKNFTDIAFTESVKDIQRANGSRNNYLGMEGMEMNYLSHGEKEFIENRDMFYMSTVGENNWPYVQFRGGPKGFLKVLSPTQIGFADFRGNMQYISTGNMKATGKAALILMDYPNRRRLKIWAETEIIDAGNTELYQKLVLEEYNAKVDRFILLNVKAFDWNCPQHITPRFTLKEYTQMLENGNLVLDPEFIKRISDPK